MNVLIVKLTSMGDVLFALSIVGDLARHRPEVCVDWAVDESFADLVACCSGIRRIWRFPFRALGKKFRVEAVISALKTIFQMRSERYDCVVDLQGMIKSSIVALAARGAERWTYRGDLMAEPMLCRFFNHYFDSSKTVPALDNYRNIGATVFGYQPAGRPDFRLQAPGQSRVGHDSPDASQSAVRQSFIVIFPFASKLNKAIPAEQIHTLVSTVKRFFPNCYLVMLSGSQKEFAQAREYSKKYPVQAMPKLSLRDTIAFIANANGFIGADTGLTHIAAAIGLPTAALFVSTDSAVFDPARWAQQAGATHFLDPDWDKRIVSLLSKKEPDSRPV